jgi:DNA-directed RNA polymerase specialized sigma24 family protein
VIATDSQPRRPADAPLRRAQSGDEDAFRELAESFRAELRAHCYRIVGSVQDAEDLVQETMLAAWRGLERFEGSTVVLGVEGAPTMVAAHACGTR